ncbi:MAG: methionyl-tRNA formyltransferase [Phycisphaeraceae bacterium]|nr:MAG: methionyl-tRNA formyltransferase [Phycisphaeraceae bacterium]
MNLVFLGSGAFGLPSLDALRSVHDIRALVTQPDRPAGRRRRLTPTPVAEWAEANLPGVPVFKPENVNDPDVVERVRAVEADAWVIIAFGQKLGRPLLEDVFAMNLHGSLLPRWRGAAPINHAILAGDVESGVTVITIADRMDAGLMLGSAARRIDPLTTAGELHDLLALDGPGVVLRVLEEHASGGGRLSPVEQDESLVTKAPKLSRADAWVDIVGSEAELCRRRINGLSPWPGVSVRIGEGGGAFDCKLIRAQVVEGKCQEEPGRLLDAAAGVVVCAGGTLLRLLEAQPPGGRAMEWTEMSRGRRLTDGAPVIGSTP